VRKLLAGHQIVPVLGGVRRVRVGVSSARADWCVLFAETWSLVLLALVDGDFLGEAVDRGLRPRCW
jgi:hypothetical protein